MAVVLYPTMVAKLATASASSVARSRYFSNCSSDRSYHLAAS